MYQPQPRRWTASTVITALVVFALAWYIVGNVIIPIAIHLAIGAVLGICGLFGFCLITCLVWRIGVLFRYGFGPIKKTKR